MREKFEGQELTDLFHLVTRAASYERLLKEKKERRTSSKGTYYKDPSLEIAVVEYDSTSESEDEEVCVAELVQGKPHPAGFVYPFDTDFSLCRERLNLNVFSACGTIFSNKAFDS